MFTQIMLHDFAGLSF